MEIVYGDEIKISATKHISLSSASAADDIPDFVVECEGTEDITDKTPIDFLTNSCYSRDNRRNG